MSRTRRSQFGTFTQNARQKSSLTHTMFKPTEGWSSAGAFDSPPSSMVSGQNCWIEDDKLKPRSGLTFAGTTKLSGVETPLGIHMMQRGSGMDDAHVLYITVDNDTLSDTSLFVFAPGSGEGAGTWTKAPFTTADSISDPDLGGPIRSTVAYNSRIGYNVAVFVGNSERIYVYSPESGNWSYLTDSPTKVKDVCLFDNSPIAWGIDTNFGADNRVQWPVGSDMEDWAGIGSGFEDLVDMQGSGTRCFADGDQLILATDLEIWRGRKIGGPFRFAFSPLSRKLGMPFATAAIKTPFGIFWLNSDYMIYSLRGNTIEPVGDAILQTLRDNLKTYLAQPFFSYDPRKRSLTFHYSDELSPTSVGCTKAFTYHIDSKVWTPHTYGYKLAYTTTFDFDVGGSFGGGAGAFAGDAVFLNSDNTVCYFSNVTNKDLDQAIDYQWQSGGLFTGDQENVKYMDEMKLDVRGDSASSLSVRASGNLGGTFATNSQQAISAQSNTTQVRVFPKVTGAYHSIMLESSDTGWEVSRIGARAIINGKSI